MKKPLAMPPQANMQPSAEQQQAAPQQPVVPETGMPTQAAAPESGAAPQQPLPPKKIKADAPPMDFASQPQEIKIKSEDYYDVKTQVFSALIDTIDLSQLSKLDNDGAREEIRDIVNDIISIKSIVMSISEQEELLADICNDVLGYGPLEPSNGFHRYQLLRPW